jgi:TRAP-type C4-dicarboxylate transport system substrate-binding protein
MTIAALLALPLNAQTALELRLATFAPANTTWHRALIDLGSSAEKSTDGRVRLRVFAGGTQGPESSVISLMRVGQLNSALLMPGGLALIDQSANVLGLPFFIRTDAELDHLLNTVGPEVAKRLNAKGFHLLNWGSAGWVQIFSKKEIRTLDDLKKVKLYTTAGDDEMVRWYRSNGFLPQPLSEREIVPQLRLPNGMIDAVPSPPYGAVALQFSSATPFMLDLRIAPLVGATVVTKAAWDRLSPADQAAVTSAARAMQQRVMADVPKTDAESVAAMQKRGLKVVTLDAKARAEFDAAAARLVPTLRGSIVPGDIYDLAVKERDAFRQSRPR